MADLLSQHASLQSIRKIGEGTFGEAFKADQVCDFAFLSTLVLKAACSLAAKLLSQVAEVVDAIVDVTGHWQHHSWCFVQHV